MGAKLAKIYYSPQGFWKGNAFCNQKISSCHKSF